MSEPPAFRYPLPRRLGVTIGGAVAAVVGLLLGSFGGFMLTIVGQMMPGPGFTYFLDWVVFLFLTMFGLIALALTLTGLWIVYVGCGLVVGHQEIAVSARRLNVVLRVGGLWWWSSGRPRARVSQLTLRPGSPSLWVWKPPWALEAEGEGLRPLSLVPSMPYRLLVPLAERLAGEMRLPLVTETADADPPRDRPVRPLNVSSRLEPRPDGLTLTVPPPGLWGSPRGCAALFLGAMWGFLSLMVVVMMLTAAGLGPPPDDEYVPTTTDIQWAVMLGMWLGIGVALAIVLFWRPPLTVFRVAGSRLAVVESWAYGQRRHDWSREELASLRVVWEEISDAEETSWRLRLEVRSQAGQTVTFLPWDTSDVRRKAELEWLATVLRQALRLPADKG